MQVGVSHRLILRDLLPAHAFFRFQSTGYPLAVQPIAPVCPGSPRLSIFLLNFTREESVHQYHGSQFTSVAMPINQYVKLLLREKTMEMSF